MTIVIENETEQTFPFDEKKLANRVISYAMNYLECPYEAEINLLFTDNDGIRQINDDFRDIDAPTDVLSFPMIEYEAPCDFSYIEEYSDICVSPESGEVLFGDIVISIEKVYSQAEEYNHSVERELAFLIVHSVLHLCGYDHMEEEERMEMEQEQEAILSGLNIHR